ncbi:MAG TPA: 50S ribosomal protein L29 [Balneolaceae bacterium]|nr:50S ribosomal protein L29 [Balneolaceae bacterium]
MKAHKMRELSLTELRARREDEEEALQNMKFDQAVAGQLENPARITMTRREIARLNTIIHEKENQ